MADHFIFMNNNIFLYTVMILDIYINKFDQKTCHWFRNKLNNSSDLYRRK